MDEEGSELMVCHGCYGCRKHCEWNGKVATPEEAEKSERIKFECNSSRRK